MTGGGGSSMVYIVRWWATRFTAVCLFILAIGPVRAGEEKPLREGPWRAWLDSPGGQLPFELELKRQGDEWRAIIVNGAERISVPVVELREDRLTLSIDYYDSTISARLSQDGARLDGVWRKKGRGDAWSTLPFHARFGRLSRFDVKEDSTTGGRDALGGACGSIGGRWSARFERSDDPAIGVFDQHEDGVVTGTFLTTTGDYRFLAGRYDAGRLRLSAFDGAHAFLFHARCQTDGTLKGDFWSRDTWHETWTARRDPAATLPDPFSLTRAVDRVDLSKLRFPDVEGRWRSLGDPAFSGKAYILDIFGTWCPNCYDASNYLNELYAKYKDRGLVVVGLAFELSGDFRRDARQVKRYVKRHQIDYPVLVAGEAVKERVAEVLPVIERLRAYPTLIFVDETGAVRGVYTGFSGPATGDAHTKMRRNIEALVESMLSP